jgi:hypothetical protein
VTSFDGDGRGREQIVESGSEVDREFGGGVAPLPIEHESEVAELRLKLPPRGNRTRVRIHG